MWILWMACTNPSPQAFDWRIDRTLVVGLSLDPALGGTGTIRVLDALVLSPWTVTGLDVELCGMVTDGWAQVDPACFDEPDLIEPLPMDALPAPFTVPAVDFACPPSPSTDSFPSSVVTPVTDCASAFPVRVSAYTEQDVGMGITYVLATPLEPDLPEPFDPAQWDFRVDVAEGEVRAGETVVLDASKAPEPIIVADDGVLRWYVDDGELLSTGRTTFTIDAETARPTSRNSLVIPDDFHGTLRVAAVAHQGTLWTVSTLEVP